MRILFILVVELTSNAVKEVGKIQINYSTPYYLYLGRKFFISVGGGVGLNRWEPMLSLLLQAASR